MKKILRICFWLLPICVLSLACTQVKTYDMADFGLKPGCPDAAPLFDKALRQITLELNGAPAVLRFEKGRYDFREEQAVLREYFISNHDQDNPKRVGMVLEGLRNLTFDGGGADFVFHGRMLPMALINSENCRLQNFSIDFAQPHIVQVRVRENRGNEGIRFELDSCYKYRIAEGGRLEIFDTSYSFTPYTGIAFEAETKRVLYRSGDLNCDLSGLRPTVEPRVFDAPAWKDDRLPEACFVALRTYERPAPGIFLSGCKNTQLKDVSVHYAEGMGLLAQLCENVFLEGFRVCLKGADDPRCFTTQADATHFSGCKGRIVSRGGLYENMMDDAINVHGTYLKLTQVLDDYSVVASYMHNQSWGFKWGEAGDSVQFLRASTMDVVGKSNRIRSIRAQDRESEQGAKSFVIVFEEALEALPHPSEAIGIENLTWTPEVDFSANIIRNNRARGALFSTPKPVLVAENLFDHTSGCAVLLCGDCNGWFETGACRDVLIRDNTFVNALTSLYQFTNAVISIYPEIPNLAGQEGYFHRNIRIENNVFRSFDAPILYAKSVDGLSFTGNKVELTEDYEAFHWNRQPFLLERVARFRKENNDMPPPGKP